MFHVGHCLAVSAVNGVPAGISRSDLIRLHVLHKPCNYAVASDPPAAFGTT